MKGGCVTVQGDAGNEVGEFMHGGIIIVKGNAGSHVGLMMRGGEIHLEGDYGGIGYVEHGKIYHKGKLIVDK
jgi:formylmethanofuran dehydrogenase subunit C